MTFHEVTKLSEEKMAKQPPLTFDEMKEQVANYKKSGEERLAKEAHIIQSQLKQIQTPLDFNSVIFIYRGLMREQITLNMLANNVLEEFSKTKQYKIYLKEKSCGD